MRNSLSEIGQGPAAAVVVHTTSAPLAKMGWITTLCSQLEVIISCLFMWNMLIDDKSTAAWHTPISASAFGWHLSLFLQGFQKNSSLAQCWTDVLYLTDQRAGKQAEQQQPQHSYHISQPLLDNSCQVHTLVIICMLVIACAWRWELFFAKISSQADRLEYLCVVDGWDVVVIMLLGNNNLCNTTLKNVWRCRSASLWYDLYVGASSNTE